MLTRLGLRLQGDLTPDQNETRDFDHLARLAQAAELSGFDSIWVTDRYGADSGAPFEAYTLLGALAMCTQTARLGALDSDITNRPPGVLAKEGTALDVVSSGRAVLGLSDTSTALHDGEGRTTEEQLDRFEEALMILSALLAKRTGSGEQVSFDGRYYRLEGPPNRPRPVQEDGLPVLIGCRDEKSLKLVAKYADACTVSGDMPTVLRQISGLDRYMDALGRDPSSVTKTVLMTIDALELMGRVPARARENGIKSLDAGTRG